MARNAVASIGNLRFERHRTDDRRREKASRSSRDRRRESLASFIRRRASPPQPAAGRGAGLAVVGHHRAVERAVERREHAALDEIEGGGLAGRAGRQLAGRRTPGTGGGLREGGAVLRRGGG